MKASFLATTHNQVLVQRNVFCWIAALSMITNLLLAGSNYYLLGRERIIVTPPAVNHSFWVAGDNVSESYLEQMATYFVGLILNVSPNSFATRSQQLLQHVHPKAYAVVKHQFVSQQDEIERRAMSTHFHPVSFKVDKEQLLVEVTGELRILIGGVPLELKSTTYQLQFIYEQGRLYIQQFKEVKHAN